MDLAIAIPTFGRNQVLVDTISSLLDLNSKADEILVIDQTENHDLATDEKLEEWNQTNRIKWIRIKFPSITNAMNIALRKTKCENILFLDDDIVPDANLIEVHRKMLRDYQGLITAGRVLQPWHEGQPDHLSSAFLFNSLEPREVNTFMGGNVCIPRLRAIQIGGFDVNFVRVAYHFEKEFAYRWMKHGYKIRYEPQALIHHLKTSRGGTRSFGQHLTTIRPDHAVGRYYYNFCTKPIRHSISSSMRDMLRSIVTRHHLRNPQWIPSTVVAELLGFIWASMLYKSGRGLIKDERVNILIIASHPIQYTTPIYQKLEKICKYSTRVLYLTLPDRKSLSLGFNKEIQWDIPLLQGYDYEFIKSGAGSGLASGFFGVRVNRPFKEIVDIRKRFAPDIILFTGWHFWGMVEIFAAIVISNIPIILRMDSNGIKKRSVINQWIYRRLVAFVKIGLVVGAENKNFCLSLGMKEGQLITCPHVIDNAFFSERASIAEKTKKEIRSSWMVPPDSYCFVFAGKLQEKKRPMDILHALSLIIGERISMVHVLIVGSGSLQEECERYAVTHQLPVTFKGFLNQTEIPVAYGISDCILLPSGDDETWGLVINEAMSCGLPAIVSDKVGCAKDLVHDNLTGFSYPCGDVARLAALMIYMATNRQESKNMGKHAQKLVRTKFTLDEVVLAIDKGVSTVHG